MIITKRDKLTRSLGNLQRQCDDVLNRIKEEEANLLVAQGKVNIANEELNTLLKKKGEYDRNLAGASEAEAKCKECEANLAKVEAQVAELTTKRDELKAKVADLTESIEVRKKEKQNLTTEIAKLEKELEKIEIKLEKKKAEVKKLETEERELEKSVAKLTKENNTLQGEVAGIEKEKADLEQGKIDLAKAIELNNQREVYIKAIYEKAGKKYD